VPRTPDAHEGPSYEEGTYYEDTGVASSEGEVRYTGTRFSLVDATGEYDPRSGGGLSEEQHKDLHHLIHFIEDGPADGFTSGAYRETTGTVFPTSIIWYEDDTKAKKLVERTITWTGVNATTDEWKMYNSNGSLTVTVSDAITYSGIFETDRTRTITVA
jgi:hypothetical protein